MIQSLAFWKILASLAVPALAFAVLYMLLRTFRENLPQLSGTWVGAVISLSLILTLAVIFCVFTLWKPTSSAEVNAALRQFIMTLPPGVRNADPPGTAAKIEEKLSELSILEKGTAELRESLDNCKAETANVRRELDELREHFFVKMAYLQSIIRSYGGSINIMYEVDEKKRYINTKIQESLQEIGHFGGATDGDPATTYDALVKYQEKKGFGLTGYFTNEVILAMITDYLRTSSQPAFDPSSPSSAEY